MPKALNGLSDRTSNSLYDQVLSQWFSMRKRSHAGAGRKIGSEGGMGGTGPNRTQM